MRVVIAGSRTITDIQHVEEAIRLSGFDVTEVVCGAASGVDTLGAEWGEEHNVPVKYFPADWKRHGKVAGMYRNNQMADYADAVIAVWDGKSRGTYHMIQVADLKKLQLFVHQVE